MTFAMTYAYSEKYILVLSHDEVVHLKCSMINKMPGIYEDKFANLKAGYTFMIGHPGKKLLFMGQDFAQFREWSEARELDWYLLAEPKHQQMKDYVKALLHLYNSSKALYELDTDPEGFEWINPDDADRSIFSFLRHSKDAKNNLLFVINFTPMARPDYRVGVLKEEDLTPGPQQRRRKVRRIRNRTARNLQGGRERVRRQALQLCIQSAALRVGGLQILISRETGDGSSPCLPLAGRDQRTIRFDPHGDRGRFSVPVST